jgi:crossover junction endodeoxyribonuclease RusA
MDLPIEGDISMELYVYPPDARKRDIDNLAKVTCDSLVRGGLIQDDNQISRLLIERRDIIDQGKVIVRIKELV